MWIVLAILQMLFLRVGGFAGGAPAKTCMDMFPKHHMQQQMSPSPYVISLSQSEYSPGDIITITVTSSMNKTFRGFILRARRIVGNTEQLVGNFTKYPEHALPKSWYPLQQGDYNCLTHAANTDRDSLVTEWKAPAISVGDIEISGAFVHHFEEFWVTKNMLTLKSTQPQNEPSYLAEITEAANMPVTVDECGKTKGCLMYPLGCTGNCHHLVAYRVNKVKKVIDFEVMSNTPGYVSVSLTYDKKMGNDETVTCVHRSGMKDFQFGYNPKYYNERHLRTIFRDISIGRSGEVLSCRYSRPLQTDMTLLNEYVYPPQTSTTWFNITESQAYYLVLAWGEVYDGTTVLKHHHELPIISNNKVDFHRSDVVYGSTFPLLYHAHAALAIIAWMTLAPGSVIIARHFKKTLKKLIGGAAIWFQFHRGVAFIITGATSVLVILMFAYLQAWTKYATVHAVLGLIAVGLLLCQLVGGFLRPAGGDSMRPIFNWGHRSGGLLALIIAAIATVLGFNVSLVEKALAYRQTIILIVWMAYHILFDVVMEIIKWKTDENTTDGKEKEGEMKIDEGNSFQLSSKGRLLLLAFYILGNLTFCVLSLAFLFTH